MKTFVAIISLVLTLTLNFSAIGAEYQLAHGHLVGSEEPIEHSKDRIIFTDPVSGERIPAVREHWVWVTHVTEQAPQFRATKTPTVRRRMDVVTKDLKGRVLYESGVAQPMGTTAPPDPEPAPVVVNYCGGYSYAPTWWGGGSGMYQSGGMWNPAGGYAGGMYSSGGISSGGSWTTGGMNSVGASGWAGGQVTSGLARQDGYYGNTSTTWVGGGMQTGGGSFYDGRNSAGASSWNAGVSGDVIFRRGESRQEYYVVPIGNGERVRTYSNMPVPDHRRRK